MAENYTQRMAEVVADAIASALSTFDREVQQDRPYQETNERGRQRARDNHRSRQSRPLTQERRDYRRDERGPRHFGPSGHTHNNTTRRWNQRTTAYDERPHWSSESAERNRTQVRQRSRSPQRADETARRTSPRPNIVDQRWYRPERYGHSTTNTQFKELVKTINTLTRLYNARKHWSSIPKVLNTTLDNIVVNITPPAPTEAYHQRLTGIMSDCKNAIVLSTVNHIDDQIVNYRSVLRGLDHTDLNAACDVALAQIKRSITSWPEPALRRTIRETVAEFLPPAPLIDHHNVYTDNRQLKSTKHDTLSYDACDNTVVKITHRQPSTWTSNDNQRIYTNSLSTSSSYTNTDLHTSNLITFEEQRPDCADRPTNTERDALYSPHVRILASESSDIEPSSQVSPPTAPPHKRNKRQRSTDNGASISSSDPNPVSDQPTMKAAAHSKPTDTNIKTHPTDLPATSSRPVSLSSGSSGDNNSYLEGPNDHDEGPWLTTYSAINKQIWTLPPVRSEADVLFLTDSNGKKLASYTPTKWHTAAYCGGRIRHITSLLRQHIPATLKLIIIAIGLNDRTSGSIHNDMTRLIEMCNRIKIPIIFCEIPVFKDLTLETAKGTSLINELIKDLVAKEKVINWPKNTNINGLNPLDFSHLDEGPAQDYVARIVEATTKYLN